jgi:DNA helicase II / ATP-dependent DNA helicase PcrA
VSAPPGPVVPTERQRQAIEAGMGPVLVLAGPGAGKTLCLIERVRHLVTVRGMAPERICAVTFTNRAAEEMAGRLVRELGHGADLVARSTIHALCVRILRDHGAPLGLERGFGIADEDYQRELLHRLGVPPRWHTSTLTRFSVHRLAGRALGPDDARTFNRYREHLSRSRMLDFDDLVLVTGQLFDEHPGAADAAAARWDYVLVDEFQDLNLPQYRVVSRLAAGHRNLFAVGDDEQSIFAWTGADPAVLQRFVNDFGVRRPVVLDENRRSARQIFELARRFVEANERMFEKDLFAPRETEHPVEAREFDDDAAETAWLLDDLLRDRDAAGHRWGECALLYRRHAIGGGLEAALVRAGIPCRMAQGRAAADEPVIRYVLAALRVIAFPGDPVHGEAFLRVVLAGTLLDRLRGEARGRGMGLLPWARRAGREMPANDADARKLRRGLAAMANLSAMALRHGTLAGVVGEILSQRVGVYRTALEERADELTDPAGHPAAVALAREFEAVRARRGRVLLEPMGGVEIGLAGLISGAGLRLVDYVGQGREPGPGDLVLGPGAGGGLGVALGTFKALQLVAAGAGTAAAGDFVALDLETTDRDAATAQAVEVAAARVRNWEIVEEYHTLVRPTVPIAPAATATHGYADADVAGAAAFADVWPGLRDFLGQDLLVAHNGYAFDFRILHRLVRAAGGDWDFPTFDTLPLARSLRLGSARLEYLAERFGIDPGRAHRGAWDVRTLVAVFRRLEEEKVARARRVALANLLDHLGVALALSDPGALGAEALMLRDVARVHALGRFTSCLDFYAAERARSPAAASPEELLERLGGAALRDRVRAEKRPSQRYPEAMARLGRLMEGLDEAGPLDERIQALLARVALSKSEGVEADPDRVNLLTLHAAKGLEFSRVYVVGVEDAELPGAREGGKGLSRAELEEARRLLYVGMTRARDRLVLTRAGLREGRPTGGARFLEEMGLRPPRPLAQPPGTPYLPVP